MRFSLTTETRSPWLLSPPGFHQSPASTSDGAKRIRLTVGALYERTFFLASTRYARSQTAPTFERIALRATLTETLLSPRQPGKLLPNKEMPDNRTKSAYSLCLCVSVVSGRCPVVVQPQKGKRSGDFCVQFACRSGVRFIS